MLPYLVHGDFKEPVLDLSFAAILSKVLIGLHKNVLGQILGSHSMFDHETDQMKDILAVLLHQPLKRHLVCWCKADRQGLAFLHIGHPNLVVYHT